MYFPSQRESDDGDWWHVIVFTGKVRSYKVNFSYGMKNNLMADKQLCCFVVVSCISLACVSDVMYLIK